MNKELQELIKDWEDQRKEHISEVNKDPLEAVEHDPCDLQHVKNQTDAICLGAVRRDGLALKYVKNQTDAICLAAVKHNGHALQFVKNQTDATCLEAVKRSGYALEHVKNQTDAICSQAMEQSRYALCYVKNRYDFTENKDCRKVKKSNSCEHSKKYKNRISANVMFWVCPDCKQDLGDVE